MRHILLTILSFFILSFANNVTARTLFRKFEAGSSLPDNNVRNMVMLPNGLICVETSTMLNTFDGVSVSSQRYDLNKIPYTEYNGKKDLYYDSKSRLWIKNRDHKWVYDLSQERFVYDIDSIVADFGINCHVDNIFIANRDQYLIYNEEEHAIHYYNDTTKQTRLITMPEIMGNPLSVSRIDDSLWILCDKGRLSQWSEQSDSFIYIERDIVSESSDVEKLSRFKMVADNRQQLWIITDSELICYDTNDYERREAVDIILNKSDIFTSIAFDPNGYVWVGSSRSGVRIIDNERFDVEHLPYLDVVDGNNVEHNTDISQIYADDKGGIWIATETEGLLYHHDDIFTVESIDSSTLSSDVMVDHNIKCMLNEPGGTILLGTIKGLYRFDPLRNTVSLPYPELSNELCVGLYRDRHNRVWLGTFHNGAYCIDNGEIRHYFYPAMPDINVSYLNSTANLNSIRTFYESKEGDIYLGVYGGVGLLDESSGEIDLIEDIDCFVTRGITSLDDDRLLINSDNGLILYNHRKGCVENGEFSFPQRNSSCYEVMVDSRGLIWVATLDGLIVCDPSNNDYRVLRRDEGLPNNKVLSVLEDNFKNVWVTTSAGISVVKMKEKWNIDDVMIVNFTQADGLTDPSFFHLSSLQGPDGRLYFGSSNGMSVVEPSSLIRSSTRTKPLLLNLRLYNKPVAIGEAFLGDVILDKPLSETTDITLKYNESFLTFEFSGLNYSNPSHTQYRYKLENFAQDWVEIRDVNSVANATFSLLHPGKYVFKVQSASNGGWWSGKTSTLNITILPPWWWSNLAIIVYVLLVLVTIYLMVKWITTRNLRETQRRHAIDEKRRKEEVEEMKMRFFENVSHELRTPLSLIITPLESLLDRVTDPQITSRLETMHRNAKSLLQLVNHLLDFRKADLDQEHLNPTRGDLNLFVESVCDSFRESAEINKVYVTYDHPLAPMMMVFDQGMMHKILNNLLSNAMKFTPANGRVLVSLSSVDLGERGTFAQIKVSDTGRGIPQKDLDFIFDRFFQASNNSDSKGTGIGLNLTKCYVEMHGGELSVESELGRGATFTALIPTNIQGNSEAMIDDHSNNDKGYKLLIVEDNRDFRDYMVSELKELYDIVVAEDGRQGLDAVRDSLPDLIISDVMMPEIDGMEMCKMLKGNIETSHIPIILLTAHSSDESRLASYESGADAFVSKPFNLGVLQARIRNLIEERKRRVQSFSAAEESELDSLTLAPLDKKFIEKAIASIENNLDNTEYSVEMMSEDLAMNRMSIYRKFKSIMDQTPAEFIRTVRLKRAARWIESGKGRGYTLIEISERFGFNTPKYFSKYFKDVYGETPMQYVSRFK